MIVQVVAALIYTAYLFLPGYLVLAAARIHNNRFLLSYGISISIVVATLLPFALFGGKHLSLGSNAACCYHISGLRRERIVQGKSSTRTC